MNCNDVEYLIHGFIDHELDLVSSLEVERHLKGCESCRRSLNQLTSLRKTLQEPSLKYPLPASLARNIRQSLGMRDRTTSIRLIAQWKPLAWAASVALAAFVLWNVTTVGPSLRGEEIVAQEILDSHIRSLMANHLTDVLSTDQHTVKPWFNGKVDFSPTVQDLTKHGFMLVGGRLDYVAGKPIAALVYQRRLHIINLFSYPATTEADKGMRTQTIQGYHLISWIARGTKYWAASDLDQRELGEFAGLFQE